MKMLVILALGLFFSFNYAFGQSVPEYNNMTNPSSYDLEIDDNKFTIPYQVNANVIAMDVDQESKSLIIGIENTKDSIFKIDIDHNLVSAQNNEFVVLVDGVDIGYEIVSDSNSSTISFFVPELSEEVEIIGTKAIPEFPFGIFFVFLILVTTVLTVSKLKIPVFRL